MSDAVTVDDTQTLLSRLMESFQSARLTTEQQLSLVSSAAVAIAGAAAGQVGLQGPAFGSLQIGALMVVGLAGSGVDFAAVGREVNALVLEGTEVALQEAQTTVMAATEAIKTSTSIALNAGAQGGFLVLPLTALRYPDQLSLVAAVSIAMGLASHVLSGTRPIEGVLTDFASIWNKFLRKAVPLTFRTLSGIFSGTVPVSEIMILALILGLAFFASLHASP